MAEIGTLTTVWTDPRFATTQWTAVLAVRESDSPAAAEALERLCRAYWFPLYAFIRRQGHHPEDAQDLVQAFFVRLLEKDYLRAADPGKGRFRTFLLLACKRFAANEWKRSRRQKRGGGREILSLDQTETETRYQAEPADDLSPEKAYDRRWALTLLQIVWDQL